MKNSAQQPAHTKGELTEKDFEKIIIQTFGADMQWTSDIANACYKLHKESKAVNMYDELIEALKRGIFNSETLMATFAGGKNSPAYQGVLADVREMKQLLKQAEQK